MTRAHARVALALGLTLVSVPAAVAEEANGKSLYQTHCSACHGAMGGGDGPAAQALEPRPASFRDAAFWKGRGVEQVRTVVKHGKPGTLMAGFEGVLNDTEIDAVVRHVESFRPR